MYDFSSQANLIIQGCIAAIILGVFYTLWSATKVYGGLIGKAIRLLGVGMLLITISVIERTLMNFHILMPTINLSIVQDLLSLVGLIFLGIGFSKLSEATKI